MSAPVDVLAVMEDAAHALNHTRTASERIAIIEARAAVAELINAAKEVVDSEDEPRFIYGSINSLRAALARIGGAK